MTRYKYGSGLNHFILKAFITNIVDVFWKSVLLYNITVSQCITLRARRLEDGPRLVRSCLISVEPMSLGAFERVEGLALIPA